MPLRYHLFIKGDLNSEVGKLYITFPSKIGKLTRKISYHILRKKLSCKHVSEEKALYLDLI